MKVKVRRGEEADSAEALLQGGNETEQTDNGLTDTFSTIGASGHPGAGSQVTGVRHPQPG